MLRRFKSGASTQPKPTPVAGKVGLKLPIEGVTAVVSGKAKHPARDHDPTRLRILWGVQLRIQNSFFMTRDEIQQVTNMFLEQVLPNSPKSSEIASLTDYVSNRASVAQRAILNGFEAGRSIGSLDFATFQDIFTNTDQYLTESNPFHREIQYYSELVVLYAFVGTAAVSFGNPREGEPTVFNKVKTVRGQTVASSQASHVIKNKLGEIKSVVYPGYIYELVAPMPNRRVGFCHLSILAKGESFGRPLHLPDPRNHDSKVPSSEFMHCYELAVVHCFNAYQKGLDYLKRGKEPSYLIKVRGEPAQRAEEVKPESLDDEPGPPPAFELPAGDPDDMTEEELLGVSEALEAAVTQQAVYDRKLRDQKRNDLVGVYQFIRFADEPHTDQSTIISHSIDNIKVKSNPLSRYLTGFEPKPSGKNDKLYQQELFANIELMPGSPLTPNDTVPVSLLDVLERPDNPLTTINWDVRKVDQVEANMKRFLHFMITGRAAKKADFPYD